MHVVQIHNFYKDLGGEDVVVYREKMMLEEAGHKVSQYVVSNKDVTTLAQKLKTAISLPYSLSQKKAIKAFLLSNKPDVVHVHNFLPIITPAVFIASKEVGVPIVVTLHNFRIICSNGLLYRNGAVCEQCINTKWGLSAIKNGCYQDSRMASIPPVLSNTLHGYLNTWSQAIDKVVFLSNFSLGVFERSHIAFKKSQVVIKPNFTEDKGFSNKKENYMLYVGRLSKEKGVHNIIEACIRANKTLKIAGTGPLKEEIVNLSRVHQEIEYLGFQEEEQLTILYKNAQALITASQMYESFGLVIIESFSYATPVIAPSFGNAGQLVTDHYNGLHYELDNIDDLVEVIQKIDLTDQEKLQSNARKTFLEKYSKEENRSQLVTIYESVMTSRTT